MPGPANINVVIGAALVQGTTNSFNGQTSVGHSISTSTLNVGVTVYPPATTNFPVGVPYIQASTVDNNQGSYTTSVGSITSFSGPSVIFPIQILSPQPTQNLPSPLTITITISYGGGGGGGGGG